MTATPCRIFWPVTGTEAQEAGTSVLQRYQYQHALRSTTRSNSNPANIAQRPILARKHFVIIIPPLRAHHPPLGRMCFDAAWPSHLIEPCGGIKSTIPT